MFKFGYRIAVILQLGQKVKVSDDHYWAQSKTGIISFPPPNLEIVDFPIEGYARSVDTVYGPMLSYWVSFDIPQLDEDGLGPFEGGEFCEVLLIPLPDED